MGAPSAEVIWTAKSKHKIDFKIESRKRCVGWKRVVEQKERRLRAVYPATGPLPIVRCATRLAPAAIEPLAQRRHHRRIALKNSESKRNSNALQQLQAVTVQGTRGPAGKRPSTAFRALREPQPAPALALRAVGEHSTKPLVVFGLQASLIPAGFSRSGAARDFSSFLQPRLSRLELSHGALLLLLASPRFSSFLRFFCSCSSASLMIDSAFSSGFRDCDPSLSVSPLCRHTSSPLLPSTTTLPPHYTTLPPLISLSCFCPFPRHG